MYFYFQNWNCSIDESISRSKGGARVSNPRVEKSRIRTVPVVLILDIFRLPGIQSAKEFHPLGTIWFHILSFVANRANGNAENTSFEFQSLLKDIWLVLYSSKFLEWNLTWNEQKLLKLIKFKVMLKIYRRLESQEWILHSSLERILAPCEWMFLSISWLNYQLEWICVPVAVEYIID